MKLHNENGIYNNAFIPNYHQTHGIVKILPRTKVQQIKPFNVTVDFKFLVRASIWFIKKKRIKGDICSGIF